MYTELHLHTAFSFLDGSSLPEDMVNQAMQLGYESLAITDHDGLHGAMEFARMADAAGLKPITGAEITLADGSHLTLLAESRTGYGNLCRLLTNLHHGRPPLPVVLDDDPEGEDDSDDDGGDLILSHLRDYAEGLILLTGCRNGQLAQLVDAGRFADAKRVLDQYIAWFGKENVFVEVQQNFVFGDTRRVEHLASLARQCNLRYVATGNVHYHHKNRHHLQDVIVAIKNRTTLDGSHRERRPNAEFYLRSPEEMERIFADYPEAIRSTELIAERCAAFNLTKHLDYSFPDYHLDSGESQDAYLARICWEAFVGKYPDSTENDRDQLSEELRLIAKLKLSGFFLIYRDLLELSKEIATELRGKRSGSRSYLPPGRGRGSAVSSIVCYLIGLSPIDPIAHNLYLGRFLNEELSSVPDIDIDFPREIREKMIERVYDIYGADHVALVCAFSTYRLRSAVRDVGKALGLPAADLDRIAKLSEPRGAAGLGQELDRLPEYAARKNSPPWSFLIELSQQLKHFPRHVTQHVGGMIISATPLNEIVPIQPTAMDGRYICQWDKDSCDDGRFVKIDFLALGMLSLVEECLDRIDTAGKEPIDLSRIDFEDPKVFSMIREGDTVGTFQVESRAQIQMLRRTKPENLKDLIVQVAIVRPGPIVGGAVTPFVQRRVNPDYVPEYDHPRLAGILEETLGVILYQEQVVQVAEILAGFRPGQADQLRRAMTRKRSDEAMQALKDDFMKGCHLQGDVAPEIAEKVFGKLSGFAEYGFPKSHAAAFGLLAYQSCWLKYYYPAEFLCSLLNNQPMGFYAPHVLINDGKRSGLQIARPDINLSRYECTVEGTKSIRIGLSYVKGLQEEAAQHILDDRQRNGDFRSLADLIRRVALRTDTLENLIAAGALDGFGLQRREMLWQIGLFIAPKGFMKPKTRKQAGKQLALALPTEQDHVELPATTSWERMTDEYRTLGLSTRYHPMHLMRARLPRHMVSTQDLAHLPDGYRIQIPGLIVCRQRPGTAKGITFLLLEDEFGLVNVVVYPDLYERQRLEVRSTPMLTIEGKLQLASNNTNIIAERLIPIENMNFGRPDSHDGWDKPHSEEVDLSRVQLMRITTWDDGPRSPADIRAVTPNSHNYH